MLEFGAVIHVPYKIHTFICRPLLNCCTHLAKTCHSDCRESMQTYPSCELSTLYHSDKFKFSVSSQVDEPFFLSPRNQKLK